MPFIARPAAGQIIDPAWGTLVADAVVMRFTTAAQRSSQLTAPVAGQLTLLDTAPTVITYWTGTAWAPMGPLERYVFNATAVTAGASAANDMNLTTLTAPYAGRLILDVAALITLGSGAAGTLQQPIVEASPISVPGPAAGSQSTTALMTAGQVATMTLPVKAHFSVTAGQAVDLKIRVTAGTLGITLNRVWGTVRLNPVDL
jgi:hypothetical protein